MPRRLGRSLDAMDEQSTDADGRWRLSTHARADYVFWNSLLQGWVGWAFALACAAVIVAVLVLIYR
jgi:hypothetical protein